MLSPLAPDIARETIARMGAAEMNAIVSRAVGEMVRVTDWTAVLMGGLDSSPFAGGVYKVMGTAVSPTNARREWAVVVKILRSPQGFTMPDGTAVTRDMAENPHNFGYWRREGLAAESGLLDSLPAGLSTPRGLGVTPISETECWLWQTYLPADDPWTLADYRTAAYRLGQWQAAAEALTIPGHAGSGWAAGCMARSPAFSAR